MKRLSPSRMLLILFVIAALQWAVGLLMYMVSSLSSAVLTLEILIAGGLCLLSLANDQTRRYARVLRRIWCLLLPGIMAVFTLFLLIWRQVTTTYTDPLYYEFFNALSILLVPMLLSVQPLAVIGLRTGRRLDRVIMRGITYLTLAGVVVLCFWQIYLGNATVSATPLFWRILFCGCSGLLAIATVLPPRWYSVPLKTKK